jgi:hypothetical protein
MSFEYHVHTDPSPAAFDAIADVLRQRYSDLTVQPGNRNFHVPDHTSGWQLISVSTEE